MTQGEIVACIMGVICLVALFISIGLHKYAWWKYSKRKLDHDPIYWPTTAIRFIKEPGLFIEADGLKYVYWSDRFFKISAFFFLLGFVAFQLLRQPVQPQMLSYSFISELAGTFIIAFIIIVLLLDALWGPGAAPLGSARKKRRLLATMAKALFHGTCISLLVYLVPSGPYKKVGVCLYGIGAYVMSAILRRWVDSVGSSQSDITKPVF